MAEVVPVNELIISDVISFACYGTSIISNVVDGTLLGTCAGTALRAPGLAAISHANIYSSLPIIGGHPTPNNYTKYNYLVIRLADDNIIEIGMPWIDPVSLSRLVRKNAVIVIADTDPDRRTFISELLIENGFLNFTINFT